jgi:hypothetical protein
MGLVSRSDLKTFLGITDSSQDTALDLHIEHCSARIESFCKRTFAAATYTDYLIGTGDKFLPLRQRPINSIASIYEDQQAAWGQAPDAFAAATLLTAGTDYAIVKDQSSGASRCGLVYRVNSVWPKPLTYKAGVISPQLGDGVGNIKVTYNAGYSTIPYDVQQACCFLVAAVKRIAKLGVPTASEGWEDYNYSLAQAAGDALGGLPPDTLAALASYRTPVIG